ncbi:hypothetical protein R84981_000740 [Carnimonas sp. R-84981]|uniref:DUF2147 domain-containing protein n=1 Tax=Carnimonas bestiolae TaxID=3402172 RepID=UPI003EDC8B2A
MNRTRRLWRNALVVAALATSLAAAADQPSASQAASQPTPVGTWRMVDDKTKLPKAIVEITQHGDTLEGKPIKLIRRPDQTPNPLCEKCDGERANQPIKGMTLLWGVKRDGDEWNGGHILDPSNGSVYRVKLIPSKDGKTMEVRGYLGISLFGRTQVWYRRN